MWSMMFSSVLHYAVNGSSNRVSVSSDGIIITVTVTDSITDASVIMCLSCKDAKDLASVLQAATIPPTTSLQGVTND